MYEFEANTEGEATRNNIIALSLDYITKSTSTAPSNSLPIRIGLMLASDFNSSSGSATNLYNAITNTAKVDYEINSKINTEGIDYFSQGHWNGNVYIENEHLKNKKFYVVVYAPIPNNVYSDNFSLKVSYKANLRHTFKFALQNGQQVPVSSTEQKIIVNNVERQITTSGYKQLFLKNTSIVAKPKTQLIGIADPNPLMHKQWNQVSSDFDHKKQFAASLNTMFQTAEFSSFYTANLYSTSVEGTLPSFTFQNPWELEADGYTQLNEPKTYSGDESFQVFTQTNSNKINQSTQPTYILNKGAVTGSNGIEYFVLGESATGATFHQAQSDDETIVKFSGNATINRTYKAKNHSNVTNVVGLDNRRLVAEHTTEEVVYRAYESGGKIWLQYRESQLTEWSNEFQVDIQLGEEAINIARNPRLVYSQGNLWVISEAYNSSVWSDWFYTVTVIDNASTPQRQFVSTALWLPGYQYYTPLEVADKFAVAGAVNSPSSQLAFTWKPAGTNTLSVAVLRFVNSINPALDEIVQIDRSGTYSPPAVTISTDLDIAFNGDRIGLAFVGNSSLYYREAKLPTTSSLQWDSGNTKTITGSFATSNYTPSIIPWYHASPFFKQAFRIVWTGMVFTSGNPQSVLWKTIGNGTNDNSYKYMYLWTTAYNYFEGVQASRVNVTGNPSSTGQFAFTVKHFDSYYNTTNIKSLRLNSESSSGNQGGFSLKQTSNVVNRSVSPTSSRANHLGVFKTSNQGLQKLNELDAPIIAKGAASEEKNFFSALSIQYKKSENDTEWEQFILESVHQGKEPIYLTEVQESESMVQLTEPFTWNESVVFAAYSSDKANLPIYFALIDEDGNELAKVKAKGERMSPIMDISAEKISQSMKQIVAFGNGNGEKVRLVALAQTPKTEMHVGRMYIPEKQEVEAKNTIADISDWTQTELPDEFGIQAYPNPFNPTTTISVSLKTSATISVQVYDVVGRMVSQLTKGEKQAGVHDLQFDASNLSSGSYFVRVQFTDVNGKQWLQTKAITLIK